MKTQKITTNNRSLETDKKQRPQRPDNAQEAVRKRHRTDKLRSLLYPDNLLPEHMTQIIKNDAGVIWLHKDRRAKFEQV